MLRYTLRNHSEENMIASTQQETSAQPPSIEMNAGSLPENYERHFVPVIGEPLARALVDAAELSAGERVLDVACGTGTVARLAAARVGGQVSAADINPDMLTVAASVSDA